MKMMDSSPSSIALQKTMYEVKALKQKQKLDSPNLLIVLPWLQHRKKELNALKIFEVPISDVMMT